MDHSAGAGPHDHPWFRYLKSQCLRSDRIDEILCDSFEILKKNGALGCEAYQFPRLLPH